MNNFFGGFYDLCVELLPIVGVVALVALIVVLVRLAKVLNSVDETIHKTHGSLDLVEQTLNKVQEPVDAVVKVSRGLGGAYNHGAKTVGEAKNYVFKATDGVKDKIHSYIGKKNNDEDLKEPSPDDILKGE